MHRIHTFDQAHACGRGLLSFSCLIVLASSLIEVPFTYPACLTIPRHLL